MTEPISQTPSRRITKAMRVKALSDIWAFADLIQFQGGSEKFGGIHRELAAFVIKPQEAETLEAVLDDERRRLIMMPRGHLKSTVAVSLYILWRIYRNPNIRILVGTNLKRLARALIRELRQYFEDSTLQQEVWHVRPHIEGVLVPALDAASKRKRNSTRTEDDDNDATDKKVIWSSESIQVIRPGKFKEPTVAAVSVGTTMTGDHYDLVILDDIVDFKNSDSPAKKEKVHQWAQDLESILDPQREIVYGNVNGKTLREVIGDEMVITGTRYYDGDYYGTLLKNIVELEYRTFIRNIYKNGKDNTDGFIWGDKFNEKTIKKLKGRLTVRQFAAQYLNEIMTDEERIFKEELITWLHATQIEVKDRRVLIRFREEEKPIEVRPILVIDPAISTSQDADYTSLVVAGYDDVGRFYLLDLRAGKWLPSDSIKKMWELIDKWQIAGVTVETGNGLGLSLTHSIRESFLNNKKRKPIVIREYKSQVKKEARIEDNLEPLFTNSLFHASTWVGSVEEFRDEINYYPRAAHDDVLDSIAMAAELANRTGQNRRAKRAKGQRKKVDRNYNKYYGGVR